MSVPRSAGCAERVSRRGFRNAPTSWAESLVGARQSPRRPQCRDLAIRRSTGCDAISRPSCVKIHGFIGRDFDLAWRRLKRTTALVSKFTRVSIFVAIFASVTLMRSTPYSSRLNIARIGSSASSAVWHRLAVGTAHAECRDCKPERSQRDDQRHDGRRKTCDRQAQRRAVRLGFGGARGARGCCRGEQQQRREAAHRSGAAAGGAAQPAAPRSGAAAGGSAASSTCASEVQRDWVARAHADSSWRVS